jgi:uncharacterized protein YbcI
MSARTLGGSPEGDPPSITAICNEAVALHRRDFGRGPGSARAYVSDDQVVCVLRDVFTPLERTLIDSGSATRVRELRAAHAEVTDADHRERMEAVIGRPVVARLAGVQMDPDLAVEVYLLGPE